MSSYPRSVKEQLGILHDLMGIAREDAKKKPKKHLVVTNKGTRSEWYLVQEHQKREYLPKKNRELAVRLARNEYAADFLKTAGALQKQLKQLDARGETRSSSFMYHALADVYEKLSDGRKELVEPYVVSDEVFLKNWLEEPYQKKSYDELKLRLENEGKQLTEIVSEKGDIVHSKSEKMIADKLLALGIPYRYECQLNLGKRTEIYPDFTILDIRERREVYFEHLGMMDSTQYTNDMAWRLNQYFTNGYCLGQDLIFTAESDKHVLDTKVLEMILRERFLEER